MNSEDADQRITLSRQTLFRYLVMMEAGMDVAPSTLVLVGDEIAILEGIGDSHPGKVEKLLELVGEWIVFRDRLKAKLH